MTTSQPNPDLTRGEVRELIRHYADLTEKGEEYETLKTDWFDSMNQLQKRVLPTFQEFKDFLTWAVTENLNDFPALNSVEYLSRANDKIGSLSKTFDSLWREYKTQKKVAGVIRRKAVKEVAAANPIPSNIAGWLMDYPGVNRPLEGWTSARQKLDAIKKNWYGLGWEDQPDPIPELLEEKFKSYQSNLGITRVSDDV